MWSFTDIDGNSVLQKAQLLQALGSFQQRFRPFYKAIKCGLAICIEAKMLEVAWAGVVTIEGNRCAREIKRLAISIGDDFHRSGSVDIHSSCRRFQSSNLDFGIFHPFQ